MTFAGKEAAEVLSVSDILVAGIPTKLVSSSLC